MFEWKVEEMELMKGNNHALSNKYYGSKIYSCENSTSREDKLAFVDSMQGGELSYLLSLIEKFNAEKDSLPHRKDMFGDTVVYTNSLKAWIKRNDKKYDYHLFDLNFNHGKFNFLGCTRYIQSNTKGMYDLYEDLVDECFHRQLIVCEEEEKRYFLEHDEYSILKEKFRNKRHNTTFGVNIGCWSSGRITIMDDKDNERDITIDELKELLSKYEQLDAFVEKLTKETHIVY